MRVKAPHQNVSASVGANASLRCEFAGDLPLLSTGWKKGITEIKSNDSRYETFRKNLFLMNIHNKLSFFLEYTKNILFSLLPLHVISYKLQTLKKMLKYFWQDKKFLVFSFSHT